ncbi:MAG: PAS domain-containing protein [Pseudomonadota bacterium]
MRSLIQQFEAQDPAWRMTTVSAGPVHVKGCEGRWECDLSDSRLRWSPPVFALFGLDPLGPIDRHRALEMYEPESRRLMERLRAKAIDERGSFTMEAQIRRADGAMRWMRLTADVVCRGGRATHLYGVKQDITPEMTA